MLKPSMQDLMKRVNNRYLLVNLAAQRARDLSEQEETGQITLDEKAVKVALDEINEDKIEYRPGPKPEPEPQPELQPFSLPFLAGLNREDEKPVTDLPTPEVVYTTEE